MIETDCTIQFMLTSTQHI